MIGDFFREGGVRMMLTTALFGFFLIASSVRLLLRLERRFATLAGVLAALTVASGALGTIMGFAATFRYLEHVPEPDQLKIAALGCAESLNNAILALLLCVLAAMLAAIAAFRATRSSARLETDARV
jgi:hypothetical protein